MAKPLFSYTTNFFLKLDVSRPAFKAQALFAADAVAADAALPATVQAGVPPLRTAAARFNDKLVVSLQAKQQENFGDVRAEADDLLRTLMRRFVNPRYAEGTDGYERFLPHGLGEYNDADEQRYAALFERFVLAMEAEAQPFKDYENPAAPAPATVARQLLTRLQNATTTDTEFESGRERTSLAISADWRTVAIAEWRLWLALCSHFADAPDYRDRVYSYFDFSEVHVEGGKDDVQPTPAP